MTKTITTYSASELKEANYRGFEKALENWRGNSYEIFGSDEIIESLKALINASNLYLQDWSLSMYAHESYVRIDWPSDGASELTGQRALAWLENNLFDGLREKRPFVKRVKQYSNKWYDFTKHNQIPDCPFTGYFADDVYLESLIDDIKAGMSLEDVYNALADKCAELLYAEYEDQNSEEYFIDHADANEYQFTFDGTMV